MTVDSDRIKGWPLSITEWVYLLRTCILIAVPIVLITSMIIIFCRILDAQTVEISPKKFAVHIQGNRKNGKSEFIFQLHPSSMWAQTGIFVKKNQIVKVKAYGKWNLAINRVVEAQCLDLVPVFPWTGPEGLSESELQKIISQKNGRFHSRKYFSCRMHTSEH